MRLRLPLVTLATAWIALAAHGQTILYTVNGNNAGDTLGQSVSIIGDANGDGFADFMAGAWRDDDTGTDAGSVRVVSGKNGQPLYTVFGALPGDHMGFGSSGAGDFDGDGLADLCAAADEADVNGLLNSGGVWLVSSATGLPAFIIGGDSPGDLYGWATAVAGDVDNDGFADIAVGALLDDAAGLINCGSASVISGRTGSELFRVFGFAGNDNLGYSVSGGDIDGDGFDDLIAGAPAADIGGNQSGSAYAFSGKSQMPILEFHGNSIGDNLARSLGGGSDVDGDGYHDLVVGAEMDDTDGMFENGSVFVVSGRTHAVLFQYSGDDPNDMLGTAVAGTGDVDGDGYGDVLVGSRLETGNGVNSGTLRLFSGPDFKLTYLLLGDSAGDQIGTSIGFGGDVNADGFPDVIAGATGDDNGGAGSGSARVYSLVAKGVTHFGSGTPSCFGKQLINTNSVARPGNQDFVVAAYPGARNGSGLLLIGPDADPLGNDAFGDGTIVYLAFPPLGQPVTVMPSVADGLGALICPIPLPDDASLIGSKVTFQHISQWPDPCGQLGALNISSSIGMTVVVQP